MAVFMSGLSLILHSHNPEAQIAPGVSNQIGGIVSSGSNIGLEGNQRLRQTGADSDCSKNKDRNFLQEGIRIGIGNIKLIGSCHCLFIGSNRLKAYVAEDSFSSVQEKIETGTAVGHVGKAVTAGTGGKIGTSHIGYPDHFQSAESRICENHCDFLPCNKGEILLEKYGAKAVGPPDSDRMEAVGNPVIGGDGSKPGIDGIGGSVNGNINREGIGGGI